MKYFLYSFFFFCLFKKGSCQFLVKPASVAQLDAPSDWRPGGCGFNPRQDRQHSSVEIDHEIFSMVILSLPLIQEFKKGSCQFLAKECAQY